MKKEKTIITLWEKEKIKMVLHMSVSQVFLPYLFERLTVDNLFVFS